MLNLDKKSIAAADSVSQFDAGSALAREAERVHADGLRRIAEVVKEPTAQQREIITRRSAEFTALVEKAYSEIIARRASWVPWTVSGPSGYNAAANTRKADKTSAVAQEWSEKIDRFITDTAAMAHDALPPEAIIAEYRAGKRNDPISAADPYAVEKLAAKRDYIAERHDAVKAENAARRKAGKEPLPAWALALPLQEIRRLNERISQLLARRAQGVTDYNGFHVEQTAERVNLFFDDKPCEAAREILKGHGFRWSPKTCTWTRQNTQNAVYSLEHNVLPSLLALPEYAGATDAEAEPFAAPAEPVAPANEAELPEETERRENLSEADDSDPAAPVPGQLSLFDGFPSV